MISHASILSGVTILFLANKAWSDQSPRHLSYHEILANEVNKRKEEVSSSDTSMSFVKKGFNMEKNPLKDSVRMPGTFWCGKGFRTDAHQEMGGYTGTDRCCRQHDLGCPLSIEPDETKYGLHNTRFYTAMHCSCDERFRSCLKMAHTQAADIVGHLFFNLSKTKCFVFEKKKVCTQYNWWE